MVNWLVIAICEVSEQCYWSAIKWWRTYLAIHRVHLGWAEWKQACIWTAIITSSCSLFAGMVNQQCLNLTKIKKCLNLTRKDSLFKGSSWFWRILGWWGSETLLPLRINSLPCQAACLTSWKMTTNIERHFYPPSCFCLFFLCGFLKDDRKCLLFHLSGFFSVGGPAFFLQFNSLFGLDESNKTPSTV